MSFYDLVYENVQKIPKGKVATYGQIANMCGSPKASRAVGYALHANKNPEVIPCHRIVNRFGSLAKAYVFGGIEEQKQRLEQEGVEVSADYMVDLYKYGFLK
ncbi:MAG: MGMT family protein [Clostridia bacterium]